MKSADDSVWVVLRCRTGAGVTFTTAWHTFRYKAALVTRPPSGWRRMVATCPWCGDQHRCDVSSIRRMWLRRIVISILFLAPFVVGISWLAVLADDSFRYFFVPFAGLILLVGTLAMAYEIEGVLGPRSLTADHRVVAGEVKDGQLVGYTDRQVDWRQGRPSPVRVDDPPARADWKDLVVVDVR